MHRLKKIIISLAVLAAIIGVAGFFIAPPIVKSVLVKKLSEALHRPVSIQEIRINPYLLAATIRGLEIREPSGAERFVSFDELYVNLDSSSLYRKALVLTDFKLIRPSIRINRNPDGAYNFSDLLEKPAAGEQAQEKKATPLRFSINNIRIEGGSLDFWDGPKQTPHEVRDLLVALPFITNIDHLTDRHTQPVISATVNGDFYVLQGKTKPFHDSLETDFDIDIKDLDIPHYLPYVPVDLNFKLLSGAVDAKLQLAFRQFRDKEPSLSVSGDVLLRKFAADDKAGRPLVRIPSLSLAIDNLEPLTPLVRLRQVVLASPEVHIRRTKEGEINLLSLLPAKNPEPAKAQVKKTGKENPASPPLQVDVGEFRIDAGKVSFRDDQPPEPVSLALHNLNLKATGVSTKKDIGGQMDLAVNIGGRGRLAAAGPFTVDPLSAELALKLDALDIRTLQGYFTDKVKINVTSGAVNAAGTVDVRDLGEKGLAAAYKGKLLIANFRSVDKDHSADFLKWRSLFFDDIRAGNVPLSVDIRRIALADFYTSIVIHEDGVMNLQRILGRAAPPQEEAAAEEKAPEPRKEAPPAAAGNAAGKGPARVIKIGAVTLQGGKIDFLDRLIQPNFSAGLSEIGGRVSGLTSIGKKPADVELRGKYNNHMPAEITGNINPLREKLWVDLKASFKDMDLSSTTPYAGRYMGYAIQKGKLSFDLRYVIVDGKLNSENKIFVDQLTLGERVESPKATTLPVGLAISLLKDRRGQINLDVPVTGSLDDPQFSLGRLIVQVIVNLITKAVTAPFALIGGLAGGGEELGYLEFDYGREALSDANMKKIGMLAKALYERPALKLDIVGHCDLEQDREGLKKALVERKVRARKFNEMIKQNLPVASVDDVLVEPAEYEKYLTQAYRAEPFPKPRTAIGLVKTLPVAEMEKLMLTHAVVRDDDLRLLAARRVAAVRDAFLKSGQVESERIFTVEPKSLAPEKKDKLRDSRIEFKLK